MLMLSHWKQRTIMWQREKGALPLARTEPCLLLGIFSANASNKTQHNPNSTHARQKRRCSNDPCLFEPYLFWINKVHLWCLLKHEINAKRSNQSKVPSINKHCFLFPLSFYFSTAVLYLLMFEFSIVIVNHVKKLGPFINLCR